MIIGDRIRDEKLQYDVKQDAKKYRHYHVEKLVNMIILPMKKYCLLIKSKL